MPPEIRRGSDTLNADADHNEQQITGYAVRSIAAVAALALLVGAPACAQPSHFGVASAYPTYGPTPYAAVPGTGQAAGVTITRLVRSPPWSAACSLTIGGGVRCCRSFPWRP